MHLCIQMKNRKILVAVALYHENDEANLSNIHMMFGVVWHPAGLLRNVRKFELHISEHIYERTPMSREAVQINVFIIK